MKEDHQGPVQKKSWTKEDELSLDSSPEAVEMSMSMQQSSNWTMCLGFEPSEVLFIVNYCPELGKLSKANKQFSKKTRIEIEENIT
ncbi:hypothetical protein PV327_003004 [Microctonus hyperodae]|uniref:Uncharacterized protein n=1 Tax=Microctonus hyperodae TaxID=165561 RepID=A0AA39L0P9_MICHY|nr:hypothetical protein PV327_003004 [Microctonus hyperodae]